MRAQVVKNLVLCGLNVSLRDLGLISSEDLCSNYFVSVSDIGKPVISCVKTVGWPISNKFICNA